MNQKKVRNNFINLLLIGLIVLAGCLVLSGCATQENTQSKVASDDGRQAFAVYSSDDNSLNFYKRPSTPSKGESFEGKTVTEIYTDVEDSDPNDFGSSPSWSKELKEEKPSPVLSVNVIDDGIKPKSTHTWFQWFSNCTEMDLNKLDTSNVDDMYGMFEGCKALKALDLSNFDTSNVDGKGNYDFSNSMVNMFQNCSSLVSLDLSNFETSGIKSMMCMFSGCSSLETLNVSSFDTSSVVDMNLMFSKCTKLKSLDVSKFNTSNAENMLTMFDGCSSLESLDVSGWDTSKVEDMYAMFRGCSSLTVDCSNWDVGSITSSKRCDKFSADAKGVKEPNFNV